MISINHSTKKSLLQPYYSKNVFSDLKVLKLFQLILCLCNSTFTMWWRWRKKSSNCLDRNFSPTFAVAQLSTYIPLQKVGSTPLQEFQVLRVCRSLKGLSCPSYSFLCFSSQNSSFKSSQIQEMHLCYCFRLFLLMSQKLEITNSFSGDFPVNQSSFVCF